MSLSYARAPFSELSGWMDHFEIKIEIWSLSGVEIGKLDHFRSANGEKVDIWQRVDFYAAKTFGTKL